MGTIVIEPRSLIREALVSLMSSNSYRVVGSFASTADLGNALRVAEAPRLVVLGALPADEAVSAVCSIRARWAETKIVLLFERASPADLQKLLASGIDGCIPLFASPETLVGTVKQIIAGDLKILVLKTGTSSTACPTGWQDEGGELGPASKNLVPSDASENGTVDRTSSVRIVHGLSPREEEILKSVVRGHSNKIIARTCGVADATVKVHMKSILRKIRVANRTQAAIWGLEQGYGTDGHRSSPVLQGSAAA